MVFGAILAYPMVFNFEVKAIPCLGSVQERPDVKIENHGLGQYGAEPPYSMLPFWQLCALKG